jgi:GTP cyclohydrolase III
MHALALLHSVTTHVQDRVMRRQSFNSSSGSGTAATPQQSPQTGVRGSITSGSTTDDKQQQQQQLQQRMTRYEPHKIERLQVC